MENLPQEVKDILYLCTDEMDYKDCDNIISRLNLISWTADYDLSAQLFDIKKK
jgi:hypothetical protein